MAGNKYTADSIVVIKDDAERVQMSPGLYLPGAGKDAALAALQEAYSNALDEIDAIGKGDIKITFDDATKEYTIVDNGRGIPHEKLLDSFTVLSSSGKFNNSADSAYTTSAGRWGFGSKVLNFLSKTCTVISMRDGKSLEYDFVKGRLSNSKTGKTKEHGTFVSATIDNKYIAINEVTSEDLNSEIYESSFCYPNIPITFTALKSGKVISTTTYKGNTLYDLVKRMKPDTEIISHRGKHQVTFLKSVADDALTTEEIDIEFIFGFSDKALDKENESLIYCYANTLKMRDGGTPIDGLKNGVVKFIKEVAMPKWGKKDQDLPIIPADVVNGMCGIVSVRLHHPEYAAQYKSKIMNPEARKAVQSAVFDYLCEQKPYIQNQISEFVKRVCKGRIASKKVRKKDVENAFSKDSLANYKPINYNIKTVCPELVLVEGLSAASAAAEARDPHNQAIYQVKKPKNIFDEDSDSIMRQSVTVFNDIMDACNLEPGKKCDPSKSTMQRILLLTDGDVDGDAIAITTMGLLAIHCKPVVDAGMVGRILPPAYSFPVSGKKDKKMFVRSKQEFYEYIMKDFVKDVTIAHKGKAFSKKDLYEFLDRNFYYVDNLKSLCDFTCCDAKTMEYIAWKYHGNNTNQTKQYWTKIMKPYDDVTVRMEDTIDNDHRVLVLDGNIKGEGYINIALDEGFNTHVWEFKKVQQNNDDIYGFEINGEKDKSLYDVMHLFQKYRPKGVTRFKGLGELKTKELKELCMNPDTRTVIIMKFKDYDEDIKKLKLVLSTRMEAMAARKELLSELSIPRILLDT